MANLKSLSQWLEEYRKELDLHFTVLTWPTSWGLGIFDVAARLNWKNQVIVGRGTDKSESLAFTKALAECIERVACLNEGVESSNGVAAHPELFSAKDLATLELFERDAFLAHFLTKTPFVTFDVSLEGKAVITALSKRSVASGFRRMCGAADYEHVLFFAIGTEAHNAFGLTISTASAKTLGKAVEKSCIQGLRNVVAYLNPNAKDLTANSHGASAPRQHQENALKIEYSDWFSSTFLSVELNAPIPRLSPQVEFRTLMLPPPFDELSLHVVQSISKQVQNLYFGPNSPEKLNIERLKNLKHDFEAFATVPTRLHPLG